jgi:hypothetical protein
VLGDVDFACGGETAGGGAGWLHEGLPVAAGGFIFVAGVSADQFGGFGGADGFGLVSVSAAFGEQREDGGFECGGFFAGAVAAAGFAAELDDVPSPARTSSATGWGGGRSCRACPCAGWGGRVWVCGRTLGKLGSI